jgi:Lamin Tail Domain
MKTLTKTIVVISAALSLSLISAKAQVIITEVDPSGSASGSGYSADWFELTNEGSSSVNIQGWEMDDSHDSFSAAVALAGISSIAAGQTVAFIENDGSTSAGSTIVSNFEQTWFGSNVPAGFTIGTYGASGSSVGLSQSGDAVNLYNSSGVLQAGVQFGVSSPTSGTFDNSVAKLNNTDGIAADDPTLQTFSVAGVNGAFDSSKGEIGSPGVAEAPEPSSFTMILGSFGLLALGMRRRITNLL